MEKLATRLRKVSEKLLEIIAKTNNERKVFQKRIGQISRLNRVGRLFNMLNGEGLKLA